MPEDMSDETLLRYLEDLLRTDKYRLKISEIGTAYPDLRSIDVEFDDIDNFNRDLAEYLLNHPIKGLKIAEEAVKQILPPDIQYPLHIRIENLPSTSSIEIRNLRGAHLGKFLAIEGLVRKVTEVRPRLIEAHFMCARCGFDNIIPQDDVYVIEPYECEGCQKGANQTSFQFLQDFSVYIDTQKIEVQENPEGLRGGEQPQRLTAFIEDDIAGRISPGDRVIINGVLMSRQKQKGKMKSTVFDIHLNVNSVETRQSDYDELEITEEDVLSIEELSQDPRIFDKLRNSIAPTIFGMDVEKEALSLQIFGGVRKFMPDGTKIRGDIHVLFVGDPGTAKSQLLRYTSQISPRGIYTSGQATTKAGLTATAVKEEFGDGRWTLEAGALVLADKGIACLHPDTEVRVENSWALISDLFDEEHARHVSSKGEQMEIAHVDLTVPTISISPSISFESSKSDDPSTARPHDVSSDDHSSSDPTSGNNSTSDLTSGDDSSSDPTSDNNYTSDSTTRGSFSRDHGGRFSDEPVGYTTLDDDLEVSSHRATMVRRKLFDGDMVEIAFESGNRITLTPDHLLIDGSTLRWREAGSFGKRDLVVAPFRQNTPDVENNTLTLLQALCTSTHIKDERYLVELDSRERRVLLNSLLRRKGMDPKVKREMIRALIPGWDGNIQSLQQTEVGAIVTEERASIPPEVMCQFIERLPLKAQIKEKPVLFIGSIGNERYELSSLPPPLFYLFGRVYTDDRRMVRETRPIRLLFQKFKRSFPEEYRDICEAAVGIPIPSSSRFLEGLYHYTIREGLSQLLTLPDTCIRAFLAGIIDTNVNVSVDTRTKKGEEYSTVILKIVMPTLERECLHLLRVLRTYNIYGRLHRRKHMYTIQVSNDSDVNNLRDLLKNYSINISALPISRPHYYDIATTYTTSNMLPSSIISGLSSDLLQKDGWGRSVRGQLEEFARGTKQPVREHFSAIMPNLQDPDTRLHRTRLEVLLARDYLLDRIVSITKVPYSGHVYDLFVPDVHNFEAGGIFVHNCIDELDKMSKEDSSGMHEALEQQQISIAKAGITATLQSRCSLLAAANPKFGRFDDSENILAQINMLPSLISRFDLIFPVLDKPNPRDDGRIAEHILKVHTAGERIMRNLSLEMESEEDAIKEKAIEAEIEVDLIRKYVAHAKRISMPVLDEDAAQYLKDYYVRFRKTNKDSRAVPITARQLEALVRLSEAGAKIRLSSHVTKEDAERAVRIMQYSLMRVATDSDGNLDIDRLGGVPQKKRSRLVTLRKIMEGLSKESSDGTFGMEELIAEAKAQNVASEEVKSFMKRMLNDGSLMEPTHNRFRFV